MPEPPFAVTMYWPSIDEVREQQDIGLRPVVLWLPACDSPTFVSEARRQLTDLQQSELNEEQEILAWLDSHLSEVWSDKEEEA